MTSIGIDPISSQQSPLIFEEFFELGKEETSSPFITSNSRHWGANLTLKASLLAAGLMILAFILSFNSSLIPFSHISLLAVYFLAGMPALIESLEDLANFEINIDILMTLAAFSSVLIGSGLEGGLLLVLFSLSGAMEDYVTTKAKSNISSLHKLSPSRACVIEPGGLLIERSVKDITVGTLILVKSGQMVPLDGVVIEGSSSLNMVHLTGENLPVSKKVGDEVPAGARNMEGSISIRVTRTSADSTLARIIQLVTQAQEERPILQRWFDRLSEGYAMAIIGLAVLFSLLLPVVLNIPYLGVEGSIYRSLAFLIAASPCALIIAIPIAYLSAIGVCARQGILLKGGISLDALASCQCIAFDKTGTLTTGNLKFITLEGHDNNSEEQFALSVAYTLERNAVHPIAKAMVEYGEEMKLSLSALRDFKAIPGQGLQAIVQSSSRETVAYIGNPDYVISLVESQQRLSLLQQFKTLKEQGELIAALLLDQKLYFLRFHDTIRPSIRTTIEDLKSQNLRLVMLTGDNENNARRIARQLEIDEYHADLKPEDKLRYVSDLSATEGLAMVGDGINDAPALARATVGISMGKVGSTAAVDASDVVLLRDNIELLGWLMKKARQTQRIVKQNLFLASLAIIVASIPALGGLIPLWLAVIIHEGGTVLVGLNGLRLLKK